MDGGSLRIQVVDPPSWSRPYDHALCSALSRAGHEVELVAGGFAYGAVPEPAGYRVSELFGGGRPGAAGSRLGAVAKLARYPIDMHRLSRARAVSIRRPDVRHFQWALAPPFDAWALRRLDTPVVLTAHEPVPRVSRLRRRTIGAALRAADAVVVHSRAGRRSVVEAARVPPDRVRVIPHGAFEHLAALPDPRPLPAEVERFAGDGPLVLFFGLLRPYKGLDVLLRAWREVADPSARLLVSGMARMPLDGLRELADQRVMIADRFVDERDIPALFRRAQLVVLPYLEAEQSGVLLTALAFGRASVATRVGALEETIAENEVGELVDPGDAEGLASAISGVLRDDARRRRLEQNARLAASGPLSWNRVARDTVALYRELLGEDR